jgi:CheY-like chemotaxis protein
MLEKHAYEGIVLDLRLPDMDGTEVLKHVKAAYPDTRVVVLSGHANDHDFQVCRELGASACFHKPGNILKLIEVFTDNDEFTEQN